jgi:hypothetical protein
MRYLPPVGGVELCLQGCQDQKKANDKKADDENALFKRRN